MADKSDPSMVLTILATAVVRSESTVAVANSLWAMKSDPEQSEYLQEITDALDMLDIVRNNDSYQLREDEEPPKNDEEAE